MLNHSRISLDSPALLWLHRHGPTVRRKRFVKHTATTDDGHDLGIGARSALTVLAAMVDLADIAGVFTRYANFTLGGGSATTAVIHGEIVGKRRSVSEEQFALSFALGRVTPGTNVLAFRADMRPSIE
jgi:Chromate transporter